MQRRLVSFGEVPDPGASGSGRLRPVSVFRHRPRNAGFGPLTSQSSTVVPQHERESWMARRCALR
jgi:hypothetical protein